ncbi:pesticin C-terminus-like muramidase [Larsenimonas rhizosphaerae]|uniref:Pesticin C-terminus-like muramidase n=1 Tax=Larsenimonas rhizosphaerae TaxID=2944682 RepID=A0AA42CYE4_9GAMM|nr:pesticin C-terminus-like muramidase [Larsenimonas rhizosphaerae]MCM2131609.1 pesticin C-terminus-like muramidase [Larsenimonas rhizosphaerae]MCX2525065.1 pesticin C-terminus-like muramidase [Larsenimonas rhizosphaerae]
MAEAPTRTPAQIATAAIDFDFIFELEQGGDATQACVPMPDSSQSGVTVGHGIDIGQMDMAQLAGLSLPRGLIEKLAPYVGLKRQKAVEALEACPLQLSEKEVHQLDHAVYGRIIETLAHHYDAHQSTSPENGWASLPSAAATVMTSVAIQYGPNLAARAPRFWSYAVLQNWMGMITELVDFGDNYATRRHREASYLKHHMFGRSEVVSLQPAANDP